MRWSWNLQAHCMNMHSMYNLVECFTDIKQSTHDNLEGVVVNDTKFYYKIILKNVQGGLWNFSLWSWHWKWLATYLGNFSPYNNQIYFAHYNFENLQCTEGNLQTSQSKLKLKNDYITKTASALPTVPGNLCTLGQMHIQQSWSDCAQRLVKFSGYL
jgi:hypothetical protein